MSFHLEKALELMEQADANNRLAHAYLITGPVGSGKVALAIRMIEMVNELDRAKNAQSLEELVNATTTVVGPESKSRRITVKAVREAERVLHMVAPPGVTKFAVIKDADRMGPEAENAFLKTLEEPPASSRLLLLSAQPEMLLETILSRCIRIQLAGKSGPAELSESARGLLDALRDHAHSRKKSVSGALGLMARFSAILKDEKAAITKRNQEAQKAEIAHYQKTTEGDYLKRREEYYKAITEAEYLQQRNRLIEYLVMWFGDVLRQQHGSQHLDLPEFAETTKKLSRELTINELSRRIDAVEELRSNLNTNVFEALALETGFIRAFG